MNLKIFTDGGSRGNPGPAACGFVVYEIPPSPATKQGFGEARPAFVHKDSGEARAGKVRELSGNYIKKIASRGKYLGITTNNEAEYQGVISAWEWLQNERLAVREKQLEINFYLDSLLVVQQLNGVWKIKEARLRELLLKVKKLESQVTNLYLLTSIRHTHIPRAQNKEADLVVNETLDAYRP